MQVKLVLLPLVERLREGIRSLSFRTRCRWRGVRIARNVQLSSVRLDDFVNIAHDAELVNADLGKRTSVGRYTKIRDAVIGPYCSISWDVTIGAVSHPLDYPSSHAFAYRRQFGVVDADVLHPAETVRLGHDVWVGCNVVIMSGVTIGDGAVIGSSAVVTKDVEPYAIVAGNPARVIRRRFDDELSAALDATLWWEWDDERLCDNKRFFTEPLSRESIQVIK